jgi:hypothetical protein
MATGLKRHYFNKIKKVTLYRRIRVIMLLDKDLSFVARKNNVVPVDYTTFHEKPHIFTRLRAIHPICPCPSVISVINAQNALRTRV